MKIAKLLTTAVAGALLALPAFAVDLKIGLQDDADVLDPAQSRTFVGRIVYTAMCDKLVDVSPDLKIVPQLATEWSWSADGKELTMKLRQGVKFHDETPLTPKPSSPPSSATSPCRNRVARASSPRSQKSRRQANTRSSSLSRRLTSPFLPSFPTAPA